MERPECPECERLAAASEESHKLGDFLDWLRSEQRIIFARYDEERIRFAGELVAVDEPEEQLLARYFGIDLQKVAEERHALLNWLRSREDVA